MYHFRIQQRWPLSIFDKTLSHDSLSTKNKMVDNIKRNKNFVFAGVTLKFYIFFELRLTLYS